MKSDGTPVRYVLASKQLGVATSTTTTTANAPTPDQSPADPHLLDTVVWRDAAAVWLAQRVFLLAFACLGVWFLSSDHAPSHLLTGWFSWDGAIYAGIAQSGYQQQWQSAFYPMLPGFEHALAPLTRGNPLVAGMLVSNLAELIALGLLRALVERELGHAVALRTLVYLVAFPTSLFFAAAYTESLFLLFSVACFVALRRNHWLAAGVCGALAALTRPVGILLAAPILVEYLLSRRAEKSAEQRSLGTMARALSAVALPGLAVGGFFLALRPITGAVSPVQSELATGWGRNPTLPGVGYLQAGAAFLTTQNPFQMTHIVLDAAFTTMLVALTIALWRRLPLVYVVYTWLSTALILMTPSHDWKALASNIRFMLVLFPLFMLLGQWGKRRWADALILACFLPLLGLQTAIFINGGWVA